MGGWFEKMEETQAVRMRYCVYGGEGMSIHPPTHPPTYLNDASRHHLVIPWAIVLYGRALLHVELPLAVACEDVGGAMEQSFLALERWVGGWVGGGVGWMDGGMDGVGWVGGKRRE